MTDRHERWLELNQQSLCTPGVTRQDFLKLRSANIQPVRSEGVIQLYLQTGDLDIRVWFRVVEDLAVDILLGTSFIDRNIQGMFF